MVEDHVVVSGELMARTLGAARTSSPVPDSSCIGEGRARPIKRSGARAVPGEPRGSSARAGLVP